MNLLIASARRSKVVTRAALGVAALGCLSFAPSCSGGSSGGGGESATAELAMVRRWNEIAVDASGLDHAPTDADHTFGEQVGPCRSARAMAMVHIAVFEAANAIKGGYTSYLGFAPAEPNTSFRAAVCKAACATLNELFPSQRPRFDGFLEDDLATIGNGVAKENGIALGQAAADAIVALRAGDGSETPEPLYGVDYVAGDLPGEWRQDPISQNPLALGGFWSQVTPFVMRSANQFRVIPPPDMASEEYELAYNEAKVLGGDGVITPTARTEEGTLIGIYWAYDGTPSLCAPPRLYNQITRLIAAQEGSNVMETCRLLALVNVAMAEAGLAVWESKYYYEFWRPVTGIRESDVGTGPSGLGDGNDETSGDDTFTPLGAPASNLAGLNFTPPFPAYPSGHAGFGGSLFQTLRRFYGTDEIEFTFISDEFNGITLDNEGEPRPLIPRTFQSLSEAEEENGQSRIYLGIHWTFDKTEGIEQGRNVGNYVFDNLFTPVN